MSAATPVETAASDPAGHVDRLAAWLRDEGLSGALIVGAGSGALELLPFCPGRLSHGLLAVNADGRSGLGFLSPMEREEAAKSGLDLIDPDRLDVARPARDGAPFAELLETAMRRALQLTGISGGDVALGGNAPSGDLSVALRVLEAESWHFVSGHRLLSLERRCKQEREVDEIRRVAGVVCSAMRELASMLAHSTVRGEMLELEGEPLTIGRLRGRASSRFAEAGLSQPEGSLVAAGAEAAVPHNTGTDTHQVRVDECVIVDLFPRDRLFADCTRTFCVGPAPEALARAHRDVVDALSLAESQAALGARGWDLQGLVCGLFTERGHQTPISNPGCSTGYVHGLGHGVGYELHELPSFSLSGGERDPAGRLEAGDVVTLEPGLYAPDAGWAVRLENLYAVGDNGLELLTDLPLELDPRSWER